LLSLWFKVQIHICFILDPQFPHYIWNCTFSIFNKLMCINLFVYIVICNSRLHKKEMFFSNLFSFSFFFERVMLCSPSWPEIHYTAPVGHEFMILLLQPPKCWDYREYYILGRNSSILLFKKLKILSAHIVNEPICL
jgi:hypothetical protein